MTNKVFMRHARGNIKNCSRGIRVFCEKYNLSYSELVFNGLDIDILEKINDPLSNEAIRLAREEYGREK